MKMPQNPHRPVHLRMKGNSCFTKETGAQWEYTAKWQTHKPYKAMETRTVAVPRCTLVSDQNDVSTGGAKKLTTKRTDPD